MFMLSPTPSSLSAFRNPSLGWVLICLVLAGGLGIWGYCLQYQGIDNDEEEYAQIGYLLTQGRRLYWDIYSPRSPIYGWFLKVSVEAFGANHGFFRKARWAMAPFLIGVLLLAYRLGRYYGKGRFGAVAALTGIVFSPTWFDSAFPFRADIPGICLALCAWWVLLEEENQLKGWSGPILGGLASSLACWTSFRMALPLAFLNLVRLAEWKTSQGRRKIAIFGGVFLAVTVQSWWGILAPALRTGSLPPLEDYGRFADCFILSSFSFHAQSWLWLHLPFFLLALAGLALAFWSRIPPVGQKPWILLALATAGFMVSLIGIPIGAQHFLFAGLLLYLPATVVLQSSWEAWTKARNPHGFWWLLALTAVVLQGGLYFQHTSRTGFNHHLQLLKAAEQWVPPQESLLTTYSGAYVFHETPVFYGFPFIVLGKKCEERLGELIRRQLVEFQARGAVYDLDSQLFPEPLLRLTFQGSKPTDHPALFLRQEVDAP